MGGYSVQVKTETSQIFQVFIFGLGGGGGGVFWDSSDLKLPSNSKTFHLGRGYSETLQI